MEKEKTDLVDQIEDYRLKLIESEVNYKNFINIIDKDTNGIIIVDRKGVVRFVNPAVAVLFARPQEDLIGKLFGFDIKLHETTQIEIYRNDGSMGIAEMQVAETIWNDEIAYLASLHDVTERTKSELSLEHYASELQRSNYELDNFAAVASHDMNEPLRKIIVYGNRLSASLNTSLKAKEKTNLEKITDSAKRLQDLIDGLLQFSRISSRAKPFEKINLNLILKAVLSDLEEQIDSSGAYINAQELPAIYTDKIQMHQVLQNIISNALKFKKADEVPVINIRVKNLDEKFWEISIEDNGIGFDPKNSEKIFKQFHRLNKTDFEGNGIGLAVCERIIHRHGGVIRAESAIAKGSTFSFTVPIADNHNPLPSSDLIQ